MQTCQCPVVTRIEQKPSGPAFCGDCGGYLPLQPPKKADRP